MGQVSIFKRHHRPALAADTAAAAQGVFNLNTLE